MGTEEHWTQRNEDTEEKWEQHVYRNIYTYGITIHNRCIAIIITTPTVCYVLFCIFSYNSPCNHFFWQMPDDYFGRIMKLSVESNYLGPTDPALYFRCCLRWLKTVSSTFQDVDFYGSLLPLFIS